MHIQFVRGQGPTFAAKVISLAAVKLHIPFHPLTSGQVEGMNSTIEDKFPKTMMQQV